MMNLKPFLNKKILQTIIINIVICISVIAVVTLLDRLEMFDKAEFAAQDLRFRIRGVEKTSEKIVIVAIDSQTLEMLNLIGMPPRDYHAKLIENLFKAGAKAVFFDVLFFVYTGEKLPGEIESSPSATDTLLSDAFFMYPNTVIGRKMSKSLERSTLQSVGESPLPPPLFQYPNQLAFVDMIPDSDSFVRRALLISNDMEPDKEWQYSFALNAAMFALDADTAWVDEKNRVAYVGDRVIPLDDHEPPSMIINYSTDERTFAQRNGYISYEQVLDPGESGLEALIKANRFKDKVVFVGATYPESKDWEQTSFYLGTSLFSFSEDPMYGVHVHKNIAETIIDNRFIIPVHKREVFFLIVLMAVVSTIINSRFKGFAGLFLSILTIVTYSGIAVFLFVDRRVQAPIIAPAFATVILNYVSALTYNFIMERRQKAVIRGIFSRYVPGSVVNELLKNPDNIRLGGEERVMTVIFSDVAGFTTISEKLTPTQLVELLNEYLTAMTDIIFTYNGIIDKYEGDAIMAEFGAPLYDEKHALNACFTALDMQTKLRELREKLKQEGRPELYARVGINSGTMVIGNMGSSMIFDYTVMGDNVNLSSRLEGANKEYGTFIMCSESTRQMVGDDIITRELDLLRVKGKTEGVLVHEIIAKQSDGISDLKRKVLDLYHEGLKAYKERRWDDGVRYFSEAMSLDDDKPSAVYLERCREFKMNPPPDDWDGIFTMKTK